MLPVRFSCPEVTAAAGECVNGFPAAGIFVRIPTVGAWSAYQDDSVLRRRRCRAWDRGLDGAVRAEQRWHHFFGIVRAAYGLYCARLPQ